MKLNKFLTTTIILITSTFSMATSFAEPVNWGYIQLGRTPTVLPLSWGEYFPACNGFNQSPIDIQNTVPLKKEAITFEYEPTPLNILNDNKTIEVEYQPGSRMFIGGMEYRLLKFQFHSPGEHLVAGYRYPMELQLLHANKNGSLAIVSVLIEEGEANPEFQKIISNAPILGMFEVPDTFIDVKALLPSDVRTFYNYSGSLTTPPCTEGVRWFVMGNTIQFSAEQIAIFQKIMPANARSAQDINLRSIYRDVN